MRRPMSHSRGSRSLDLKMTPMIDVVFQLLIFFVCTANFQALEKLLPTWLSPASGGGAAEVDPQLLDLEDVVIRIARRDGLPYWELNHRPFARLDELRAVLEPLARLRADLPVILDADDDVPIGDVIDLYDACSLSGFVRIQFAAKAES